MTVIRAKNNTEQADVWAGITIQPDDYYTLQNQVDIDLFASSAKVNQDIWSDPPKLVINDGGDDLSPAEGDKLLKGLLVQSVNANISNAAFQTTGELKVAPVATEGSSAFLVSHDFCDRTTWWSESVKVENEELSADLLHLVYTSDHEYWIDLEHGKVLYEDKYAPTYKPHIYVDGQEVTSGFTIDYANGTVTFNSSKAGHTVTATYHYENGSNWIITPDSGKFLRMLGTEIKFSKNVELTNGQQMVFGIYVGDTCVNEVFYKSVKDLIKGTVGNICVIPSFGGLSYDVLVLPYDYITVKDLKSSLNMKVKVGLKNREALSGTWGSISASCLSIPET